MSLPSGPAGGYPKSRGFRAPSFGSLTSPRLIPQPGRDSADNTTNTSETYGSFRSHLENPPHSASHRDPARSSVHLSYRGPIGALRSLGIYMYQSLIIASTGRQCTIRQKRARRYS